MDPLTGISNRRHFEEALREALASTDKEFVVAVLDLDDFKKVNDTHGHAAGDALIRAFAERLTRSVDAATLVARVGGDEFVVLLAPADAAAAEATAERICATMAEPLPVDGHTLSPGTSIGIAVSRPDSDRDRLMTDADQALYAAKAAGRSTWRHAAPH